MPSLFDVYPSHILIFGSIYFSAYYFEAQQNQDI